MRARRRELRTTLGARLADQLARGAGSWPFILIQTILWGTWIVVNLTVQVRRWDPYPFILLNLALSFQAAYAAPIIMMSQNRQARRDRDLARRAFHLERRMAQKLATVQEQLDRLESLLSSRDGSFGNPPETASASYRSDSGPNGPH
jgi:uncharacterized membrane protein